MAEIKWRPIEEAPVGVPVLIYDPNASHDGDGFAIAQEDHGIWLGCDEFSNYVQYKPTHWARVTPPEDAA